MKKKVLSLLLASTMVLSMAACGSSEEAPAANDNSAAAPAASSDAAPAASSEAAPEAEKLDFGGQVITWLIRDQQVDPATGDSRMNYLYTIEMIEKELNVDIQWEVLDDDDAVLTKLTSGELPDLISWKWNDLYREQGGIPGLYNDGICIDLTEMIETKMPNLQAVFAKHPNVAKDMKNSDGQYLYFQRINPLETVDDIMASTSTGIIIRQDWLDNVGMDVPTDIASWYEVLTAFKTMDPNGNGELDELPFDGSADGLRLFEAAFGMDQAAYIDPATGKVEYGARSQAYKAFLEEMNKWYSEGLIVNVYAKDDSGNLTVNTVKDKDPGGSNENIGADLAGSWKGLSNANGKDFVKTLKEKKPEASITPCPWPATADGKVYSERTVSSVQAETTLVTTDCECLDAVAAVIDWMYSEKGSELICWGEEGVSFEYDADGKRKLIYVQDPETGKDVTPKAELPYDKDGDGVNDLLDVYKMYGNTSTYLPSYGCFDINLATRDEWYKNSSKVWAECSFDIRYPGAITLSAEQADKVSVANNQALFDYIAEMRMKFITGEEPLSGFDNYVAQLETMGMSDIVAVYQEAYDEYMSR
ncbi:MAG: hypothetical protein J6A94_08620 [Lachnospiraceae bacterium]|nr:hypothetical protein [Lachnospiraceae bacterium]